MKQKGFITNSFHNKTVSKMTEVFNIYRTYAVQIVKNLKIKNLYCFYVSPVYNKNLNLQNNV